MEKLFAFYHVSIPYHRYCSVSDVEEHVEEHESDVPEQKHGRHESRKRWMWAVLLFMSNVVSLIFGARLGRHVTVGDIDNLCIRHISRASPFIEDVGVKWSKTDIDGRVFHTNTYKKDPSPELDALWDGLGGKLQEIVIPEDIAETMGFTDEKGYVRVRPEYGGGFLGEIDGLHQLHCLNAIRMTLWWNFEHYKNKGAVIFKTTGGEFDDLVAKYHVFHCVDMLRQELMCNLDVGVAPFVWSNYSIWNNGTGWGEPEPAPTLDFTNTKPCRNFWDVVEYTAVRQWMPNMSFAEHRKMLVLPGENTPIRGVP